MVRNKMQKIRVKTETKREFVYLEKLVRKSKRNLKKLKFETF